MDFVQTMVRKRIVSEGEYCHILVSTANNEMWAVIFQFSQFFKILVNIFLSFFVFSYFFFNSIIMIIDRYRYGETVNTSSALNVDLIYER